MTHPSLTLKRWHPLNLEANRLKGNTTVTFDAEPPGRTLLVDIDPRMAKRRNLVTLYRAAKVNGLLDSLFETNPTLQGQPWYDRLPRITAMDTEAVIDGEKMAFTWIEDASWNDEIQEIVAALGGEDILGDEDIDGVDECTTFEIGENAVAEYIVVRILVRTEYETQIRRLRTDFGVGTQFTTWPADAGILVTPDCALDIEALKNLIAEAVFEYSLDEEEDSPQTRWCNFVDEADTVAVRLLLNEHDAIAGSIRQAARTHLRHLLPDDRTVQLRKKPDPDSNHDDVEVRILPGDAFNRAG